MSCDEYPKPNVLTSSSHPPDEWPPFPAHAMMILVHLYPRPPEVQEAGIVHSKD